MSKIDNLNETSLRRLIYKTLELINLGSADEIAMQMAEQQGISSEQGLADITIDVTEQLNKMAQENQVQIVKDARTKNRYSLAYK
ncbi:MAG: hypothetical protein V4717_14725 [Bacteroidota bacterium]